MKTFIERIDKHIREEGMPFGQIIIPSSYLPTYINYAILQRINEKVEYKDMFWPEEYTLEYDDKNRLFLRATSYNKRNNILIYSNNDYYFTGLSMSRNNISDLDLYDYALILKYYEDARKKAYEEIEENYKGKINIQKRNEIRYKTMHSFYEKKFHELGKNIRTMCSLEDEIDKSVEMITSYIDYLNRSYQEDMEAYRDERMVYISYKEKENIEHKRVPKTGLTSGKERKNEVISMDERREALESYDYEYFGIATPTNKVKKDYYCYLYKDYEGRNVLVLEPYCGTKYTKVVYLDTKDLSKEEFKEICIKVLELSNDDTVNNDYIIRLGHTTKDVFTNNIDYIITNNDESKCKEKFKERVRTNRNKVHA